VIHEQSKRTSENKKILNKHLPELKQRYRIKSLELFGSRIRGKYRPDSDLDILVSFSSPPSLLDFVRLKYHLSELLGLKVDLVMREALKPNIGPRILDEAVPEGR
jgi:predicted nucleotidyltransferase